MPPKGSRRLSVHAPPPSGSISPATSTALSSPTRHFAIDIPARNTNENAFDYTNRCFATELLRPEHETEAAKLRELQDQQISDLKTVIGTMSKREKSTLLQRYASSAGQKLKELEEALAEEKFCVSVLVFIIWGLVLWVWGPTLARFLTGLVKEVPELSKELAGAYAEQYPPSTKGVVKIIAQTVDQTQL